VSSVEPGGKERMRRLLKMVQRGRVNPTKLITHKMPLSEIMDAYHIFENKLDNSIKIAIIP